MSRYCHVSPSSTLAPEPEAELGLGGGPRPLAQARLLGPPHAALGTGTMSPRAGGSSCSHLHHVDAPRAELLAVQRVARHHVAQELPHTHVLELDPAQEAVRGEAADLLLPGDELGDGLLQAGVAPLLDPVLGPHHQRPVQLALGGAGQVGDLLTSF